jgi:hypothetical protein
MKRYLLLLYVLLAGLATYAADSPGSEMTFYLQVVHGNNTNQPPGPEAKPIGPKLSKTLHSIFKWDYYWEVKRDSIALKPGGKTRKRMTAEREIEIMLISATQMEIRMYRNGKVTRIQKQSTETRFFVLGGEDGENQAWFIIVRRDEPQTG